MIADSTISDTEFPRLKGLTENIEDRLNNMKTQPGVVGKTLAQGNWHSGSFEWTPSRSYIYIYFQSRIWQYDSLKN